MRLKPKLRAALILLALTILFHWRILISGQFTMLYASEGIDQAYSWYSFWVSSIRHGILPLWDAWTFAGHPFAGEMQTAAFYPPNLLLLLFPSKHTGGVLSPFAYHFMIAFGRFAAAYFMYLLAVEFEIGEFAAILSGVAFGFGGAISHLSTWPHILESGLWLPLIFLFLLRALRSSCDRDTIRRALVAGLFLGLSALAGGLHVVIMQAIVVISACAFAAWNKDRVVQLQALLTCVLTCITGFAIGAPQLLASFEYSQLSLRWLGPAVMAANEKIPYYYLSDRLYAQGIVQFLMPQSFDGHAGAGEVLNPYIGVLPFLLACVGLWCNWTNKWVRYLAGLATGGIVFAMGARSFLHGIAYPLVPELWMAREAPRFLYLADFALALFAGLGAQALFSEDFASVRAASLSRIFRWIAVACAIAVAIPAIYGQVQLREWNGISLLLIFCSLAVASYVLAGNRGCGVRVVTLFLILSDLYTWDWTQPNKIEQSKASEGDAMERLRSLRPVTEFLKGQPNSRPGTYRVTFEGDIHPNIGDTYGVEILTGGAVTLLKTYFGFLGKIDLLNARYVLRPASAKEPDAIYADSAWKVYRNNNAYPRAWLVHEAEKESSEDMLRGRMDQPSFDGHRTALIYSTAPAALDPPDPSDTATVSGFESGRMEVQTHSAGRSLLVLSEIFYPGWKTTVNGAPAEILQVDGALRGVVVPRGDSTVRMVYAPASVYYGGVVSVLAFAAVLFSLFTRNHHRHTLL